MASKTTRWWLLVGGGVLVGLLLVALLWGLWWAMARLRGPGTAMPTEFRSNGEGVYFTATSQRGTPVTFDIGVGGMMWRGSMACVTCHGADGQGGRVRVMMRTLEGPDIRYKTLTAEEHGEEDEHGHEPWSDETIKRAITEGVEPDGEPLDWPMPRWSMSDEDLDDLLEFLKALY